jgi:hypothetical protein
LAATGAVFAHNDDMMVEAMRQAGLHPASQILTVAIYIFLRNIAKRVRGGEFRLSLSTASHDKDRVRLRLVLAGRRAPCERP